MATNIQRSSGRTRPGTRCGLHQDQPRLQALLCGTIRGTVPRREGTSVRARLRSTTRSPQMLDEPLRWKSPQRIFVNSMSDLFHDDVPLEYIQRVFDVMNEANWHQYQILTKRAERVSKQLRELPWAPHIWMGVSVENEDYLWPHRPPAPDQGACQIPLDRTAARTARQDQLARDRLGDCRRRIRPRRPADESPNGSRIFATSASKQASPSSSSNGAASRRKARARTRRPDLGRNARTRHAITNARRCGFASTGGSIADSRPSFGQCPA